MSSYRQTTLSAYGFRQRKPGFLARVGNRKRRAEWTSGGGARKRARIDTDLNHGRVIGSVPPGVDNTQRHDPIINGIRYVS